MKYCPEDGNKLINYEDLDNKAVRDVDVLNELLKILNILEKKRTDFLDKKNSDARNLALFTQIHSIRETQQLISKFPQLINDIGKLILEFRLYYDCFWQLFYLEDDDRVNKFLDLYHNVKEIQDISYQEIFTKEPKLSKLLNDVVEKHEPEEIVSAHLVYICDEVPNEWKALMIQSQEEYSSTGVEGFDDLGVYANHTMKAWGMLKSRGIDLGRKFFTEFTMQLMANTAEANSDELLNININKITALKNAKELNKKIINKSKQK